MSLLQRSALGAGACSAMLLTAALAFQYLGGLAPCPICIWQRWPHLAAVILALIMIPTPYRILALVGSLTMIGNAGIALYHTGIERRWWPGPDSCTGRPQTDLPASDLLDQILATPAVLCDEVAWQMFGLSMASWNGIGCLIAAWLWLRAYASSSASQ